MQIRATIDARGDKAHTNAEKQEMLEQGDAVLSEHLSTIFVLRLDQDTGDAQTLSGTPLRPCNAVLDRSCLDCVARAS